MTAKHTPGPWFCDERSDGDSKRYVLSESAPFPGSVAFVCLDISEAEANARLIAAAPDLLDALLEAVTEYRKLPHSLGYEFTHLPMMESAIKKARGES